MEIQRKICPVCFPQSRETKEVFFQKLDAYINNLAAEDRADQALYDERLRICSGCGQLFEGMCRLCGCYVSLRAAQKVRACPDVPRRW